MDAKLIRLRSPSPRERALAVLDSRMVAAKSKFSAAAVACLRGASDAEQQVHVALKELDAVRYELALLSDAELDESAK